MSDGPVITATWDMAAVRALISERDKLHALLDAARTEIDQLKAALDEANVVIKCKQLGLGECIKERDQLKADLIIQGMKLCEERDLWREMARELFERVNCISTADKESEDIEAISRFAALEKGTE